MTETNNESDDNKLDLAQVVEVPPQDLSDPQKTFLQDNVDDLSDEQKETFSDVIKKEGGDDDGDKKDDDDEIDVEKLEIETRRKAKEEIKDKKDDDDGTDPEDEATIKKVVDKSLKEAGLGSVKDQVEVDNFIRSKPEYGKYRGAMLKYMSDPAYNNIPAHNLAAMVSAKDQQKIGAQKERTATKKADDTQSGGSNARPAEGVKKDWSTASKEEYEAKRAEVLQRKGD